MALKFEITGDNSNFLDSLNGARAGVDRASREIEQSGASIEDMFKRIATAAGIAFSLSQVKDFANSVMQVRGQFQQLEIAFKTMLQSEDKANALMAQLVDTAAKTPFDLQGVSEGAKQLLAYGTAAEEVNETVTRLGDIAAGLSIPLGDLVYLYGTTMTQGRMFTQDLRQFMGRGIPMADELAKIFGVAKDEVAGLVTAGKVGAEQVKQAIWNMTNEGSKFGGLMSAQSASITGQISNIEDAIDSMMNDIGKSSEGIINAGLSTVSALVENYKEVGAVLASIAAAYGTYKAAIVAVSVAQRANITILRQAALEKKLAAAASITLSNAEAIAAAKGKMLALVQNQIVASLKGAGALLTNPYILLATAVGAAAFGVYKLATAESAQEKASKSLNSKIEQVTESQKKWNDETEKAIELAEDDSAATMDRDEALQLLIGRYPEIIQKYIDEKGHLRDILGLKKEIAQVDGQSQREEKTETLRQTGLNAWNNYNSAKKLISAQLKKDGLTQSEKSMAEQLKAQYKEATGTSAFAMAFVSMTDIRDYYESLAKTSKKAYNRNLTENKILDFTKEGGKLESYNDNQLKELQKTLQFFQSRKYAKTSAYIGQIGDYLTADDRHGLLTRVNAMISARNEDKGSSVKWAADAKKKWQDAKKAYEDYINSSDNSVTQATFKEKAKDLKQAADDAKKAYDELVDNRNQTGEDKRVKAAEEINNKLEELELSNQQERLSLQEESTQKEIDQIEYAYEAKKHEIEKQAADLAKANKEAGLNGLNVNGLTADQQKAIDEAFSLNDRQKDKSIADVNKKAIDSMREYVKEYGSFEQQRLAVTEEYEKKIAKATTEGEKLSLQREQGQKLAALQYDSIASGLDWRTLFSGVGTLSKEMLQPMMDQLMAYTKTDEYLNADSNTQQDVAALIQELRQYLGTDQSMTWQALGTATENFVSAVGQYNTAVENERAAIQRLEQAKQDLAAGRITQAAFNEIKAEADKFGQATADARDNMQSYATTLNNTSEQVANFTSSLTAALNNAKGWKGVEGFGNIQQSIAQIDAFKGAMDSALPAMGDGIGKTLTADLSSVVGSGLSSLGSGLSSILSSGLGQAIGFIAQIPRLILDLVKGVKDFVAGVLDSFTELISLRWIDDLVVSICDAIANLVNAIFDLPENLFKTLEGIVVNGVGGLLTNVIGRIGNILSFGSLSSGGPADWFTNSNAEEVAETIERLTKENEQLEQAIEDLKEEMEKTRGAAAIDISSRAAELQRQTNENYKAMAQAQAGYHGSHHSWNYYWGGYNQEQINRLSKQIGRQWNGDLWDLSPEEMKMLRSNVDMWNQIKNSGKSYYGEAVQEKLNDYIEQAGKLEEITDALYENLTTKTKEDVFDEFLDSLYELADGSEDVFDNIADAWQEMVNRMVVNNLIGAKFQQKLDKWYEELAKLNESKTNDEIADEDYRRRLEALKAQYEDYVKDAQRDIETMRDEGIIKATGDNAEYKQEASSEGFQAMGQDTGEELNGRFTALQISGDVIAQQAVQIYGQMIAMTAIQTSSNNCLIEIRNMMITANSYLDDVAKYSKKMYLEFGGKLDSMIDNTKNL